MSNILYDYSVVIKCMTYNHASYITDALDGFTMQQTNFPFIAIIVDDASTDNEQEVIQSYIDKDFDSTSTTREETNDYIRVVAQHKHNPNCTFVVVFLKYNHYRKKSKLPYYEKWQNRAKYIALCEGDDYWTDSLKLQKQVDLLEKNKEFGLCYTDCDLFVEKKKKWVRNLSKGRKEPIDCINPLLQENPGYRFNMTWLYRKDVFDSFDQNPGFIDGAMFLLCSFCLVSKLAYIPCVTGVYRRHEGSASCFRPDQQRERYLFDKNMFELIKYFAPKYDNSGVMLNKAYSQNLSVLLYRAVLYNDSEVINDFDTFFDGKVDIQSFMAGMNEVKCKWENKVRNSNKYRLGKLLLNPITWFKNILS